VYSNREGNGNEASGDGFRFRGGGIFKTLSVTLLEVV
jgi:predicted chitinase